MRSGHFRLNFFLNSHYRRLFPLMILRLYLRLIDKNIAMIRNLSALVHHTPIIVQRLLRAEIVFGHLPTRDKVFVIVAIL